MTRKRIDPITDPAPTVQEPLRDRVARAIYEDPNDPGEAGGRLDHPGWYHLSEERREPWRRDADRAIAVVYAEFVPILRGLAESVHKIEFAPGLTHVGDLHQRMAEARAFIAHAAEIAGRVKL